MSRFAVNAENRGKNKEMQSIEDKVVVCFLNTAKNLPPAFIFLIANCD